MPKGLDYVINLKEGNLSGAADVKKELSGIDGAVENTNSKITGIGSGLKGMLVGMASAFTVGAIKGVADELLNVRGQFQGFENLLKNSIGDSAGVAVFEEIKEFAKNTPFEVDQLTESFIKLQGSGFNPTMEKMGALGDIAAAKMKGVDQFTEAIIDAQTGEFERLKEFGIRASKSGNDVTFTYNGVAKTMKFSQQATEDYLLSLAKMPGIAGSMDAMADTYIGKQSNINDSLTQFKNGLAIDLKPALDWYINAQASSIDYMQKSVDWFKRNYDIIVDVATVIGIAGGAYLLYQGVLIATQVPMAIVTAAQWALNVAMTANPIGLIVVGIGLLAGGLYIAYKRSETFRAGLSGLLEVGKLLGSVFMGVGKTILGALTFNKDLFLDGVKESVKVAQEIAGGGISKAFNRGFNESISESAEKEKQSAMDKLTNKPAITKPPVTPGGTTPAATGSGTSLSTNKQVRNVMVTIGKLVENLTVSTTNLQATGSSDIKRIITEILTAAVHDSELALANG